MRLDHNGCHVMHNYPPNIDQYTENGSDMSFCSILILPIFCYFF